VRRADPKRFWLCAVGEAAQGVRSTRQADVVLDGGRSRPLALWKDDAGGPLFACADTPSAPCAIVFDGRLHVRDGLEAIAAVPDAAAPFAGSPPATLTDAELVLTAYLGHGVAFFQSLRGSFLVVIWDARDDTVAVVRDHVGTQPAFYAVRNDALVVSPSPEEIAASGPAPAPSTAGLADWVLFGRTRLDETLFAGVRRLPQGHLLRWRGSRLATCRYWVPPLWPRAAEVVDSAAAARRFDSALEQAVERCLDERPTALFLSGGVDSAVVAAVARDVRRRCGLDVPHALSLVFPDAESNEEPVQRAVANALMLPQTLVPLADAVGEEGVLLAGLETAGRSWQPCVNPWEAAYDELARRAGEQGYATVLTGNGGNEVLEVPWGWSADLLRRGDVRSLAAFAASLAGYLGGARRRYLADLVWASGLRPLARDAAVAVLPRRALRRARAARATRWNASLPAWALPDGGLRRVVVARRHAELPSRVAGHAAARMRRLDSPWDSIYTEAVYLGAVRTGVAQVAPLYDPDVVTAVVSVSPGALLDQGGVKGVAGASFATRLGASPPRLGVASVDRLFDRILNEDSPIALTQLHGLPMLRTLGVVSGAAETAVRGLGAAADTGYYQRWQVLAAEAWLQRRFGS
jgi:hypothetical protein